MCYVLASVTTPDPQAQLVTAFIEFSQFDHCFAAPPAVSHVV